MCLHSNSLGGRLGSDAEVDLLIASFCLGRLPDRLYFGRNSTSRTAALAKAISQLELLRCANLPTLGGAALEAHFSATDCFGDHRR